MLITILLWCIAYILVGLYVSVLVGLTEDDTVFYKDDSHLYAMFWPLSIFVLVGWLANRIVTWAKG